MSMNNNPVGVAAALSSAKPVPSSLSLFSLPAKVAIVTGGHRGIGLEMALAFAEAGAIVYCLDLPGHPDDEWLKVQKYAAGLPYFVIPMTNGGEEKKIIKGRLEYVQCDVTKQRDMWSVVEGIADKEGRLDVCVANAGILRSAEALDYPAEDFQKLLDININGVLYTAQAAGRQMEKRNTPGSIIMIASMSGSITNKGMHWTAYNTSKAAVIQMARSLACELGPKGIRVNSISPGYVYTE